MLGELIEELKLSGWPYAEELNKLRDKSAAELARNDARSAIGSGGATFVRGEKNSPLL